MESEDEIDILGKKKSHPPLNTKLTKKSKTETDKDDQKAKTELEKRMKEKELAKNRRLGQIKNPQLS